MARRKLLWTSLLALTLMLLSFARPLHVWAATAPPYTVSHYVDNETGNAQTDATAWGNVGKTDAQTGRSGVVILAFGAQRINSDSDWGIIVVGTTDKYFHYSVVENITKAYISSWFQNSTSSQTLSVGIGTNNGGNVSADAGVKWASLAGSINTWAKNNNYTSRVYVKGATDIELDWDTAANSLQWVNAYDQEFRNVVAVPSYIEFGDAGGCPPSGTTSTSDGLCNNNWLQSEVYHKAYGVSAAYPVPQIYNTAGTNAKQWQQVSMWGHYNGSYGSIAFLGSMTQQGACNQNGGCSGTDNSPATGWSQLYDAVNCTDPYYATCYANSSVPHSTDIKWN